MTRHLFLTLREDENAILITRDGKLAKGFIHHPNDLEENGDAIQDLMIKILKHEEAQRGFWLWKICDNWSSVSGCPVKPEEPS